MKWNNKTILIVEDDEVSSILLEELLEETKVNLIFAINGKEAIRKYKKVSDVNLVLMDLQLPEMDGFETLESIRKINPIIPVIAQTAFFTIDMKNRCLEAGFNDFLAKPLSVQELIDKISPYLKP